ncbi:MAG: hypothetical protein IPI44_22125 [Sulfuritalea sp.]|nr:hypothetical protein [Sulfuritalea sp.]
MNASALSGRLRPSFALAGDAAGLPTRWLGKDLIAGFSACIVSIPSVIAYAELVHLPPITGLYAALAAAIGYAPFSSSRQVIAGPMPRSIAGRFDDLPLSGGDPARIVAGCDPRDLVGCRCCLRGG